MAVPSADLYKWVGWNSEKSGAQLAKVREAPVADHWSPMSVHWVPETKNRLECDFPIFHPVVRAISNNAVNALGGFFGQAIEFLPISGIDERYQAFHCTNWIDAAVLDGVDQSKVSIQSTLFVPRLRSDAIFDAEIFGVQGFVAKLFVSSDVRDRVINSGLTGLDFYEVQLEDWGQSRLS